MKKGYGICPGTCGELVQGLIGKNEYISSYCVDLYSKAKIYEKKFSDSKSFKRKSKSIKAISDVFQYFGYSKEMVNKIELNIKSNIPIGKGMASSTADIGASIMAALDFLGEQMHPDEVSKLVSAIEPTDSIYHKEICIFNPIKGLKKKSLGFLDYKKVLVLEPEDRINTIKIRKDVDYYKTLRKNMFITKKSFELLEKGIRTSNGELIKKGCINSAIANESIKKTPYLYELYDLVEKYWCGFLNISHTGTVVGIALGEKTDVEKLMYDIEKSEISSYYDKKYIRSIIAGGIRER